MGYGARPMLIYGYWLNRLRLSRDKQLQNFKKFRAVKSSLVTALETTLYLMSILYYKHLIWCQSFSYKYLPMKEKYENSGTKNHDYSFKNCLKGDQFDILKCNLCIVFYFSFLTLSYAQ